MGKKSGGRSGYLAKRQYRLSDLAEEHRLEVIGNIGLADASKSVWEFVPDYPVDLAAGLALDTSCIIFDWRVESVKGQIRQAGKVLRPILIDDLHEDAPWMEGHHRALASEWLKLKTIPALVRVE